MASSSLLRHLFTVFSLIATVTSLEVTPGSDCAALCLGGPNGTTVDTSSSGTNSSDIVCENSEYHTTGTGIKFKNCISCLEESQATKGAENDAAWFLYNVRYAVDVCLYGFPDAISTVNSPCLISSACSPLKTALTSALMNPDPADPYEYCTADGNKFTSSYWPCAKCLQSSDSQSYLSNFLIALKAGCDQKPADGNLVAISGELFSDKAINISVTKTTLPGDGGASSTTMTLGTIVGIAVGGGLLFIGAVCLFIVYCRKQRRQKEQITDPSMPLQPLQSGGSSYTAINKSPYIPIVDHKKSSSIRSYNYELQEKQNFSNNAEYYDKLEQEGHHHPARDPTHYNFDPHSGHHGLGSALPTHPAYIPRAMSRQSHRTATPTPPAVRKTNVPDSYALQTYLNAAEETAMPSLRHPPAAVSRSPSPAHSHESRSSQATRPLANPVPPPPPPPQSQPRKSPSKIPSLVLPSVPRIRVPKKYSPPQITVQDATPVADKGETGEMHISQPIAYHEERFQDRPLAGRPVISHVAPAREDPQDYEGDMPIRSGKSTLYG